MTPQQAERRTADLLWTEYARTHDPRTREALITQFERLAYSLANRYAKRGAEFDDICQVARLGLVKAVDRFDPATNYRFTTFATPTILGEIRRYFRDRCRPLHVPRAIHDLAPKVERAAERLAVRLGRSPKAQEIAESLGIAEELVVEVLALESAGRPISLHTANKRGSDDSSLPLEEHLVSASADGDMRRADDRVFVHQALRGLSRPLRDVIQMRYLSQLTQREVAKRLGCTQINVCRMEKRALEQLRGAFAIN